MSGSVSFVDTAALPPPPGSSGSNQLSQSLSASRSKAMSQQRVREEELAEERRKKEAKQRRKKERAQRKAALEKEKVEKTLAKFDQGKKRDNLERQAYLRQKIDLSHKMRKKRQELEAAREAEAMAAHKQKFEDRWKQAAEADEERKEKEKKEAEEKANAPSYDDDTPLKRALLRASQFSHAASNARILAQQNQLEYQRNTSLADVASLAMAKNKSRTTFGDESDEEPSTSDPFALEAAAAQKKGKGKGKGSGLRHPARKPRRRRASDKPKVAEVHPGLTLHAYALDLSEEDEAVARQNRLVADERLREMLKKKSESAQYHRIAHMAANARVRKAVILERFGRNPPIDIQISADADQYNEFVTYQRERTPPRRGLDSPITDATPSQVDDAESALGAEGGVGDEDEAPDTPASYAVSDDGEGERDGDGEGMGMGEGDEGGSRSISPDSPNVAMAPNEEEEDKQASELARPSTGAESATLAPPTSEPCAGARTDPSPDLERASGDTNESLSKPDSPAGDAGDAGDADVGVVDKASPASTRLSEPRSEARAGPAASLAPATLAPKAIAMHSNSVDVVASRDKLPQLSPNTAVVAQPLSDEPALRPSVANDLSRTSSDIDPTVLARRRRNRRRQFPKQQMAPLSFNQIQESYPSKESTVNSLGLRLPSLMQSLSKPTPRSMGTTTQW